MNVVIISKEKYEEMVGKLNRLSDRVNEILRKRDEKRLSRWMDNQEVCQQLRISPRTLQTLRDNGMLAYSQIGHKIFYKPEDVQRPMQDSKGALQEFLQRDGSEAPTYEIIAQDGPPHNRTFEAAVSRFGVELAHGTGRTKKQAEQAAALAALQKLKSGDKQK